MKLFCCRKSSTAPTGLIFADRFYCDTSKRVGSGSFGSVFSGEIIDTREPIAIKIEKKRKGRKSLLAWEASVYEAVGARLVPKNEPPDFLWYGDQHGYRALVMRLLGPSIEDVFQLVNEFVASNHRRFSTTTCCVIGVLMLQIIEGLHDEGYVHRDIKPANFLMGLDSSKNELKVIDFGLVTSFLDSSRRHIAFDQSNTVSLIGTPRFASLNSHNGCTLSRRDDLESIAYTLLYLLKGTLPWWEVETTSVSGTKEEALEMIKRKKAQPTALWCRNLPVEFVDFLNYSRNLKFEERPSYSHWIAVFTSLCSSCSGSTVDDITTVKCDWHNIAYASL
ncbi:hypothetical protein RCL1_003891 [Eukaryota sp. TZLM3-RCL]